MKNLMLNNNGVGVSIAQNVTRYFALSSDENPAQTEANSQTRLRDSYTWYSLRCNVVANSFASGNNTTITARINGVDSSNLIITVNGGVTGQVEDLTDSDSLVTGNLIGVEVTTPNVTGSFVPGWISSILEGGRKGDRADRDIGRGMGVQRHRPFIGRHVPIDVKADDLP